MRKTDNYSADHHETIGTNIIKKDKVQANFKIMAGYSLTVRPKYQFPDFSGCINIKFHKKWTNLSIKETVIQKLIYKSSKTYN